ncbi:Uncharacterized membrane protein YckC, RDD family [Methylomagnum ishizawai]|uniref:Uncharacterized membrane protein YckC, RDD family n=1 Tax=Methylomagnum ishizawai TaxID=1760988 RepID=A0A1Y6CSV5_9GAMM|nr:RDD family protein [Methylomagnum ishizawai]SMF93396.1 Uncharacterized membrane protein YckC, RDD family [Methylomagnum ishizawai]
MTRPPPDTVRVVVTPEGCELVLRLAGPAARARAFCIDALIRFLVFVAAATLLGRLGSMGMGLLLLAYFGLAWGYPVLFEVFNAGATPGKRLCGLAVLRDDGTPVGWDAAFLRNALRFVDAAPVGYAVGLVTMGLNGDGKRLGDILAGTVVVYRGMKTTDPGGAAAVEGVEPPPFPLGTGEQRALLEYRRRAALLTPERALELAALAAPLTAGLPPEAGRARLFRLADFLLGRAVRGRD